MSAIKYISLITLLSLLTTCQFPQASKSEQGPSWVKLGPGGGGSTFLPTFSYHEAGTHLLRCDMTGAYFSRTGGATYSQINFPGGASAFAFDPSDSLVVYIGSKTLNRSVDGGNTWEQVFPKSEQVEEESYRGDHADYSFSTGNGQFEEVGQKRISNIRVDPAEPFLYFSMGPQLYYSVNNGADWEKINFEEPVDLIYTNRSDVSSKLLVCTAHKCYIVNKEDWRYSGHSFPKAMASAFSFTAGTNDEDRTILYGLSNDNSMRQHGGEAPIFSKVATSEDNGSVVYLVAGSYQEAGDKGETAH